MTETKARFCDICEKLVSIQKKTWDGKGVKWRNLVGDYWESKDGNVIVCPSCWKPLYKLLDGLGTKEIVTELCAWVLDPYEEDNTCD